MKWIKTKDRLPEKGTSVWCAEWNESTNGWAMDIVCYSANNRDGYRDKFCQIECCRDDEWHPQYWMELPEPPKESDGL